MIFGPFFFFIFALTFHKCQIVMKAILSFFLIFGPFFVVFDFSFHFCFDLPQVSIVMRTGGLITAAGEAYDSGWGADRERLMTADGGLITAAGKLITGAGKAYDSGRGAFCVRFGFFLFMKAILSFFDFWTLTFWKVFQGTKKKIWAIVIDIFEGQQLIN